MFPLLVALAACGAPEPYAVVVAISGGIEPTQDAALAATFADRLEPFGFETTLVGTPLAGDDLVAAARAAAKHAGASHAVVLELSSTEERDGVLDGTRLYAAHLTTHVVHVDATRAPAETHIEHVLEATDAARVEDWARHTWTDALVPWTVSRLYDTPEVQRATEGDVDLSDLAAATAIEENGKKVWLRTERERDFQTFCADQRARLTQFGDSDGVRCFGDPCGQATVVGVDASDRAIVQDISRTPVFTIPPSTRKRGWIEAPERVTAVPLSAPEQGVDLVRAANLYGFANVGPRADAGVVETFSTEGTTAVYAFSLHDGSRTALAHLAKGEETSFSRAAPDGKAVFFCLQTGDCWFEKPGFSRKPQRSFRRAEWLALAQGHRVVGQLVSGELAVDDPTAETQPAPIPYDGAITRVLGVVDGIVQLYGSGGPSGCSLVRLDPVESRITEAVPLPQCIRNPSLVPDGRLVGTARAVSPGDIPGDDEIVVWDPGADAVIPLTTGPFHEEYAYTTHDGTQVVFNRRLEAPPEAFDTKLYRRVVCVTDLP